jgi:type IV pilus assembly protein PilC
VNEPLGPAALVLLLIPAIALRLAVRALFGHQPSVAADPMQTLLSMASTILFVLAILGLCVGLLGFWALVVLLPFIVPMVISRLRHSQHRALVWSLAAAAERGIPLSEAARAYADETLGDTGVRALALAEAIERGEPLSAAVRAARLRMGSAIKLAVRLGERLGLLGPAMRQQLADSQQLDSALRDVIGRFAYLCVLIFALTGICMFLMLKIIPVMQRIFQEFGLKLPAMTSVVINISSWYVEYGWFLTLPVVLVAPALVVFGGMHFIGWFPRDLPIVCEFFKRYDGALIMRGLSLAIRRGMGLPQAMRLVADCYPIRIAGGRLTKAADRVAAGMNWCDSLRNAGFISGADVAVLSAAERVGNLDWALEEMADSSIRRQIYRVQACLQLVFPVVLVLIGMAVGFFVVGLFIPLVSLIQGLA